MRRPATSPAKRTHEAHPQRLPKWHRPPGRCKASCRYAPTWKSMPLSRKLTSTIPMKPNLAPSLSAIALFTVSLLPAAAAEPNADQLLRQMSAKLAAAKNFSFKATREIDPALIPGHDVLEKAQINASVQRPNKLAGRAEGRAGARRFVFDGRTLTIVDEKMNHYATVPMQTTLDGLVDQLDQKYGFVPPLAEFALSDPYKDFRRQAQTIAYAGRAKTKGGFLGMGGTECHKLALKGKEADAELWIAAGDQLPRKLVATFHRPGNPQVRIDFSGMESRRIRERRRLHLHPAERRAENRNVDHRENAGGPQTLRPSHENDTPLFTRAARRRGSPRHRLVRRCAQLRREQLLRGTRDRIHHLTRRNRLRGTKRGRRPRGERPERGSHAARRGGNRPERHCGRRPLRRGCSRHGAPGLFIQNRARQSSPHVQSPHPLPSSSRRCPPATSVPSPRAIRRSSMADTIAFSSAASITAQSCIRAPRSMSW